MATNPTWHTDVMYKHKDVRVPRAGTHVKMHGIAKGPAAGSHIAKR